MSFNSIAFTCRLNGPSSSPMRSRRWFRMRSKLRRKIGPRLSQRSRGSWLHDLYHRYKTDLFSANLRGYLGSRESESNINNGIKTTAHEQPRNFYVYNNGITALVLDYELGKRSKRGRKLKITGISIVNGAQTTGSIANLDEIPSSDLQVAIRFVKANKDAIIANVVRFNNSQNKLQAADFRSTDPIQERLRTEFDAIPDAEYEGGRRGGASDVIKRSKFTLPSYTVGQSLAAFHGDPVMAYDKKSELWTNERNYRQIFTDRTTARHIVFCYSLLSAVNTRKLELSQKQKNDPSSLTNIENASLSFLNKKGANYLLVHVISQCMETILGKPIPNRFDLHFSKECQPEYCCEVLASHHRYDAFVIKSVAERFFPKPHLKRKYLQGGSEFRRRSRVD